MYEYLLVEYGSVMEYWREVVFTINQHVQGL